MTSHRLLGLAGAALLALTAAGCPDPEPESPGFTAIASIGGCSASIVALAGAQPDDKALMLTNGHCIRESDGFLNAGEALAAVPTERPVDIIDPDALVPGTSMPAPPDPSTGVVAHVTATELVYATMTGTDMALYRLDTSYRDLEEIGVQAMTIADRRAEVGTAIHVVSGFWHTNYRCTIDAFVDELREDMWSWQESMRYRQPGCETTHGTSGSPVIDADTLEVVGVNNTGNDQGASCTFDNPCEVDADGQVTATQGAAYGQQTYWIYGCLGADHQLDFDRPGCRLTKPTTPPPAP